MKKFETLLLVTALLAGAASAHAASPAGAPMAAGDARKDSAKTAAADMTEGEVRKVDLGTSKITIQHGEIKNLGMPGMTMAFPVRDAAMLDKVKAGDKIRFRAEKAGSAIVVSQIVSVKFTGTTEAQPATAAGSSTKVASNASVKEASISSANVAEGEVRKVDRDAKKITIKHGIIKNLDMPPMSMVFQVKDPAFLEKVQAGDKVKFTADKVDGAYTVLSIETSK